MEKNIEQNFKDIEVDLETRWIELSKEVRQLSADLRSKATESAHAADVRKLSAKTELLCDHVERIHADVLDLLENLDTRLHLSPAGSATPTDEIEREKIQIQREQHAQTNFKDVIKALFMYVDDPKERVAQKR
ncbi:MAG: hypothetical protein NWT08_12955 [Akkermansiaceae bacterium]|jgi:hypothetical protein|nr:hypothetical protein [Akkermansiaceae bacterium]MDP4647740.1 hypothetical protein [Akkermansiaceae bacterium]MDP4722199.1 hypothetical protein [Akkermansiaceae bacterium]MDP4780240.1 hypothetical protein [Akkermansiaceae bacterium]MDP4848609.1 hypothetical protein [Akkermansiaceae bacterium]